MCDTCSKHWADVDLETGAVSVGDGTTYHRPPIPEKGCEFCLRYFGWSVCRKQQYKDVQVLRAESGSYFVVARFEDNFIILAEFLYQSTTAYDAMRHLVYAA
jgi:hypothetical protein